MRLFFFLKAYEHVGNVQFSLELNVAFRKLRVAPFSLGELWLATGLLRRETTRAMSTELGAPRRELRAVDALASK
jgi:hypothetical protein